MDIKNQKILVLSIDHYEVTDETTGQVNAGTTVWYYGNPELEAQMTSKDSYGLKPAKLPLPADYLLNAQNVKVPCIAVVDFIMRPDSKGKMQLSATNFRPDFESGLKLTVGASK